MRPGRLAWLVAVLGGAAALPGCYDTPRPTCAFLCGQDATCPDGYSCRADSWCKRDDVADDLACALSPADGAPIDSSPGDAAPVPDASPADASLDDSGALDAAPTDASPDASPADASPPDASLVDAMSFAGG
ncbi:MAG TPA: hypothetical protein VK698_22115 [Kofleriaceae bacterium]|nr:hypothetical protein [Kofleriaceae bacterium]